MNTLKLSENLLSENFIIKLFNLLSQLTESTIINKDKILEIIRNLPNNHYIYVCINENNLPIGIVTIIIEQKLIHGGQCVAHIEDLVVDKDFNGMGIATKLINKCINTAKDNNCYKIILDCKEELIPFYNKNNFVNQGFCMRYNI